MSFYCPCISFFASTLGTRYFSIIFLVPQLSFLTFLLVELKIFFVSDLVLAKFTIIICPLIFFVFNKQICYACWLSYGFLFFFFYQVEEYLRFLKCEIWHHLLLIHRRLKFNSKCFLKSDWILIKVGPHNFNLISFKQLIY